MGIPLVSVITPCYNEGQYLLEAVLSVKQSTYNNIEMIIIDDCSTDKKTIDILFQIEKDFDFVKVIRLEKNEGVCIARNKAILMSSGKYILPLDADDKISKDYIEDAVEVLEKNDSVSLVVCDFKYFGKKNYIQRPMPFSMGALSDFSLKYMSRNQIYFILKHFSFVQKIVAFSYLFIHSIVRKPFLLSMSQYRLIIASYKDGFRMYKNKNA